MSLFCLKTPATIRFLCFFPYTLSSSFFTVCSAEVVLDGGLKRNVPFVSGSFRYFSVLIN